MTNLLTKGGIDVGLKDENGRTPLHLAAGEGHIEVIKLLISKGANINSIDVVRTQTTMYLLGNVR